jgi:hypothetical protein
MKTQRTSNAGARLLVVASLAFLAGPARAVDPDLPYSSGSTGADGPLTFRQVIPGGRAWGSMAYDAARNRIVLFGGQVNGVNQNDTWLFDGVNWTRVFPANSPVPRYGHRMVYDAARQQVVLFGGHRGDIRLNDTWVWDGTNWTQKTPANSPSPREYHAMAYDAARQEVVLHGGNSAASGNAETWTWNGTDWTLKTPATSPPGHNNSALAYDAARQEVLLFGNNGQTWVWNGTTWTQRSPFNPPSPRNFLTMDYDPIRQEVVLFSGSNQSDTWTWNGTAWTRKTPTRQIAGRQGHMMAWYGGLQRMVVFGGDIPGVDNWSADTDFWNGTDWSFHSGKFQTFDMTARANGVWNFTSINIPSGVTVVFQKNVQNTPVRWLATEDVVINGAVDLSGEFGANNLPPGVPARGGPGGFDGGRGGIRVSASGSFVGSPGLGPGGGAPGTAQQTSPQNLRDGQNGEYNGVYGNAFLQPLIGGSGGGGGASNNDSDGGNGGGGGGAIMIASSRDITLNGVIRANGGDRQWSGASQGGLGSGGAILLRADRVTGPGTLQAYGGHPSIPNGRIRVEAYVRSLTGNQTPTAVVGLPAASGELNQVGTLTIVSVDGVNVVQPPSGNLNTPDVVFSDAGPVNVVVNGTGIPDGTPVNLRVTTANSVINAGPANLQNGTATITVTVPAGVGTLQATAQFTQ